MSNKAMQELNIKLWEAEEIRARLEEQRMKKHMDDDPRKMIIDCNLAFAKLLDDNQGKARLTPEFAAKVNKLARKEKRAKHLAENYDYMKAMDDYHEAKMHLDDVVTEVNNLKFRYRLHWEKRKDKRREIEQEHVAEQVKDIVDKVSK